MQCPPKPGRLNTEPTKLDAEHVYLLTQKRLSKNVHDKEQGINVVLRRHAKTLLSVKSSMQGLVSAIASTSITLGRGLSFFFALTAITKPWNITMKAMSCGGQSSRFVNAVMPRGIM